MMSIARFVARRLLQTVLLALLVSLGAVDVASAGKRVALIIGNSAYRSLPTLANPINDAKDIGDTLRKLGFETIVSTDLDRAGMNDALDRFSRITPGADMAFVYYSGHGMQFQGSNYLLPIEVKLETAQDVNRFRLMPVEDILEVLKSASGATMLLLDACRNNPVEDDFKRRLASVPGANRAAIVSRGFARIGAGNGIIIAYATQANDVASDGFGRNSPFAKSFLKFAPTPDLDLRQMLFRVQDDVDRETDHKQRPELSISLIGEFKLASSNGKPVDVVATPSAKPRVEVEQEDIAWPFVRNTTDITALREFVRQFPTGRRRAEAETRIAELTLKLTPPKVETTSPTKLAPLTDGPARSARPRSDNESCADRRVVGDVHHYCVSSRLGGQFGNSYRVSNLFSGGSSVAWVEGASGQGIGEWITVEFDGLRVIRSLSVDNGYQKTSDIYYKNSRVRRVRLVFSSGETLVRTLDDKFGSQEINFGRPITATWVQLIIEDVFYGSKYSDTAIAKLIVNSGFP